MENVNQATQTTQEAKETTGLWWKVPLALTAVAAVGYGIYKLCTGDVEEVL